MRQNLALEEHLGWSYKKTFSMAKLKSGMVQLMTIAAITNSLSNYTFLPVQNSLV